MSNIAIKIENLSKQYRLGLVGTGTLSHDLKRWWAMSVRGQEDPYLKIGETNDRASKGESEYVWALRDINLEIEQGDVVGIIGKNGAGKSTLLKILSRVTKPSTGSIKYNGRIASLLEVGTGFHPEMTGRENIYMNGSIMGMTRHEITSKLDEIIAFAGVERYIDTPVKRYSSGMTVRLGFSIAAHLEPDILVVDEVLAVGDAEFQKKAIGKMQDVSKGGGRTVLFVSHNMAAVKSLCNSVVLLKDGLFHEAGSPSLVIDNYLKQNSKNNSIYTCSEDKNNDLFFQCIKVLNYDRNNIFYTSENLVIFIEIKSKKEIKNVNVNVFFKNSEDVLVFVTVSDVFNLNEGINFLKCNIPGGVLNDIPYYLDFMIVKDAHYQLCHDLNLISILGEEDKRNTSWNGKWPGLVRLNNVNWSINF